MSRANTLSLFGRAVARFAVITVLAASVVLICAFSDRAHAQGTKSAMPLVYGAYLAENFDSGNVVIDDHAAILIARMARSLETHDLAGFLSTHTYAYFREQLTLLLSAEDRKNGYDPVAQYTCEFLSICDVSKSYELADIKNVRIVRLRQGGDGDIEITWRFTMTDGIAVESSFFYDARRFGFYAAFG